MNNIAEFCDKHEGINLDKKRDRKSCRKCRTESVQKFRIKTKTNLIAAMGGKCIACGYNKYRGALEFHHLNPKEKLFNITGNGLTKKSSIIVEEARKCALLCANCHREESAGLLSNALIQTFNEDILNEIVFGQSAKDVFKSYNKQSDAEVKLRRLKKKKKWPSKEELENLVWSMPTTEVAKILKVSDSAIGKQCKKLNISKPRPGYWMKIKYFTIKPKIFKNPIQIEFDFIKDLK